MSSAPWSSCVMVSWLITLILVFTVHTTSNQQSGPLYGIVLYGHPYPKRPPPPIYHTPVVPSYHPVPPPYRPPAPVPYKQPPPPVYKPAPAYKPPPPPPAYKPAPAPAYQPPPAPVYQPPPAPYQPAPAGPYIPKPVPQNLPVPSSYDGKPWNPLEETSPYIGSIDQVNEIDGYPWTEPLYDEPGVRIPEILFYPEKPTAQAMVEETTDYPYQQDLDESTESDSSWRWPSNR